MSQKEGKTMKDRMEKAVGDLPEWWQNDCPLELLGHHCRDSWHYDCAMEAHLFGGTIASASTEKIRAAIPELRKSGYYMAEDMLAEALSVLKQRGRRH